MREASSGPRRRHLLRAGLAAPRQILSREQLLNSTGLADKVFDPSIDVATEQGVAPAPGVGPAAMPA